MGSLSILPWMIDHMMVMNGCRNGQEIGLIW